MPEENITVVKSLTLLKERVNNPPESHNVLGVLWVNMQSTM